MRDAEQQILFWLKAELDRLAPEFAASGVSYHPPEVEVWRREPHDYTSEIRLTILLNGEIGDVLEFHVFRDGKAVVTVEQAITWLQAELLKIIRQAGTSRST